MTNIAIIGEAYGEHSMRINLTQGYQAIVDEDMYEYLSAFNWCVYIRSPTNIHAARKCNGQNIYMHHLIVGFPLYGCVVDHINRDGLDNRRKNLRIVTKRGNSINSTRCDDSKGYEKSGNGFIVRPYIDGIRKNIGIFYTEDEAIKAFKETRNGK